MFIVKKISEKCKRYMQIGRKVEDNQEFRNSKREVKQLYRELHKLVKKIYPRQLQQKAKILVNKFNKQLRYIFKNAKNLQLLNLIQQHKQIARHVIQKVNSGQWKTLPQLQPQYYKEQDLAEQIKQKYHQIRLTL